ncbi:response regulator [candidate division KSB1 bacterium]|nr:MAG: response regulator [candidate division KSB1 bacterium]
MRSLLVIEDELGLLKAITNYFVEEKFDVIGCSTKEEAVRAFEQKTYDVVLLDIRLPSDSEGLDLLEQFRKSETARGDERAVVIVMTAFGHYQYAKRACNLGADGFIEKPEEMHVLLETINSKLGERAETDALLRALREWSKRVKDDGDNPIIELGENKYTADDLIREIESGSEIGKQFRLTFYAMFLELSHPEDEQNESV